MAAERAGTDTIRRAEASSKLSRTYRWSVRFARSKPLAAVGGCIVIALIVIAVLAPVVATHSYAQPNVVDRFQGPSWGHFFGTDNQGRDTFSRVIYGARITVVLGFGAVAVSTAFATLIGVISAYAGGIADTLIQRLVDIWMAFPGLIFLIFVISIFGASTSNLVIVLGLLFGISASRVIRSSTLAVKELQYVEAARVVGASNQRIILRHILPNITAVIIVTASVQIGAIILAESSLAFLGFGTPPPFPSWGRMLQEAQPFMQHYPHLAFFPGLAIALVVFSLNMLGDGIRDVLDPRLRGAR